MKIDTTLTVFFIFISYISFGQQTEFEKIKAQEDKYRQSQNALEKQYSLKIKNKRDSIAFEYLKYEIQREQQILKYEGKNLNPRLVELAKNIETLNPPDYTFSKTNNPTLLLSKLKEKAIVSPYFNNDKEITKINSAKLNQDILSRLKKVEKEKYSKKTPTNTPQTKTAIIAQKIKANLPVFAPLKVIDYRISSHFNINRIHPIFKKPRPHYGIDLAATKGKPIYASASGIVEIAQYSKSAGKWILLNHQNGYKTQYFHLHVLSVKSGDNVKTGDLLGYVGATGYVSGSHLHYEIRKKNIPLNPHPFFLKYF